MRQQLIEILVKWAETVNYDRSFQRILLFGSLIYREAELLRPASDIDLLFEFSDAINLPRARAVASQHLVSRLSELELLLAAPLGRSGDSEIVSSGAVTRLENDLCIDIGADLAFTRRSDFLDLLRPAQPPGPLGKGMPEAIPVRCNDSIAVLRKCQAYRKQFLSVSTTGTRKAKSFTELDLFPKDMARTAARLRVAVLRLSKSEEQGSNISDKDAYDILCGSRFLQAKVEEKERADDALKALSRLIAYRLARSQHAPPLSEFDQLLLWELLASIALDTIEKELALVNGAESSVPSGRVQPAQIEMQVKTGDTSVRRGTSAAMTPATRDSRVIPIRLPTPIGAPADNQPTLPAAQRSAVAALLGILVPDEKSFRDACADAVLSPNLFWAATSPADRWFSAISTAVQVGVLRPLLERASLSLPLALRWRVRLTTDCDATLRVPRWDRRDLYEYRGALGQKQGGGSVGDPDIVGLSALRRVWGDGAPDLVALRRYLDATEREAPSTADDVDLRSIDRGDLERELELELGLAAEHLVAWCDSVGGEQLLAWTLEHVNHLSPSRFAVITAVVHWWDDGRKVIETAARAIRDQSLDLLSGESINAAVSRLSALDRLLYEAGAAWWAPSETPPSVQLAVRAGRLSSVAQLLEVVGERRPAVLIDQITRFQSDRGAVVALARALRRLRIAGVEGEPVDPELSSALRCSLPDATAREINLLVDEPRKRAWWLDLLSPPLSDVQIAALIKIYGTSRHTLERDRARRWLCTTLDPLSIWQRLPKPQRRQWVEGLTDFELLLVARLADRPPPYDFSERQDWTLLQQRVASARNTTNSFS